jgi:hypothetical protein
MGAEIRAWSLLFGFDLSALPDGVRPGQDQDAAADVPGDVSEVARDSLANQQSDDRHDRLEQPERNPDPQPSSCVDAAQADPDRSREVAQANRDADQQKAKESGHAGNYMEVPGTTAARRLSGVLYAFLNKNTLRDRMMGARMASNLQSCL